MSNLLDLDLNPGVGDYKPARRKSSCKPKQSKFKSSAKLCEELADTPCTNCSVCGKAIPSRTATGKHPIMIIGMYPGKTEVSKNKFYTGDSGQYLIAVLTDKGFDVEHDVHMTNIMRCPRPLNEKDHYRDFSTEEIKRCGQYTINEIQQVEPSLIILMGDLPLRYFFNKKSVTTSRGQVRIKGDYKFLTTYNAAHIIRSDRRDPNEDSIDRKAFEDDIQTAYEIYNGISRTSDRDYVLVKTIDQFDQVIDILSGEECLSVDVETYAPGGEKEKKALDPYSEGFQIISIAISSMENTGFCFLLEHPENPLTLNIVLPKLKALLEGKIPKIGQNIKYDFKVLGVHFNIFLNNIVFDTMVAHSLIDDRKGTHGLDRLALDFLGERSYKFEMGKIGTYIPRAEDLCIRNCTDADYVLRLYPIFVKKLEDLNMYDYYMSVMAPATPALGYVEMKGIPANKERVAELVTNKGKTGYYDKLEIYEAQAKEFPEVKAIPNFNIQSSQDLGTLLFDSFCFPVTKETKGHKPCVDKDVIDDLIRTQEHPFLTVLKNYRECSKMLSTYLVPYLKLHIKKDRRVHSTFTQHIAATGRLSSVHPNLQNIPARIDAAQDIMSIFFREGWKIGLADYCLHPDTEIECLGGKQKIKDVVDQVNQGRDIWVYCYRFDKERIGLSKVTVGKKTGVNKEVWKVILDNGESVTATPEHKFMLRDGSYVELRDLKPGDSLMPFYSKYSKNRNSKHSRVVYRYVKAYSANPLQRQRLESEQKLVALDVMGFTPEGLKGKSIHHRNGTGVDNLPNNLEVMLQSDHFSFHRRNETPEIKQKAGRGAWSKTEEGRIWAKNHALEQWEKLSNEERKIVGRKISAKMPTQVGKNNRHYGHSWRKSDDVFISINHRVIEIQKAGSSDVYNITVEGCHNFVLSSGIVVKNSQMELRILAEASNDPKMLQAFLDDIDLHALTGQELTKIIGAEVNRDRGKTFNFGVVYGMTEHGFVEKLGCSFAEAKMYLESYFKIYEGVKDYQERMQSHLRQYGYVETLFGRRRYLRMRHDDEEHALRQAINTPIQGTATDINTIALTKLVSIYLEKGFESFPISSIHDALMFEMHPDEEDLRDLNIHVMTHLDLPFMKRIPLKVDWTEGKSWAEAKLK